MNSNSEPTTRQRVYNFIVSYKAAHDGNSPTVREIAQAVGLGNQPALMVLRSLEDQGLIKRAKETSRGIIVVGAKWIGPEGQVAE